MKIVCAETVLLGHDAFSNAGETIVIPDRDIKHSDLLDADALIVRSKTKITAELIQGTPVKFIGTATAGTDHIDALWLDEEDLYWCASPGCNANSVSEYVVAALLVLDQRQPFSLAGKNIGIVGCGNVGRQVAKKCEALGMNVLRNDPPLAAVSSHTDYLPLETVLAESDIITLHVPLITEGPWPTRRLVDYRFFEQLKPGAIFINAARGSICDYDALLAAQSGGAISQMILDVWHPEPAFRTDVLKMTHLASPHIAGHSYEGKLNGTITCYNELCNFFEIPKRWEIANSLPALEKPLLEVDCIGRSDQDVLHQIIQAIYPIETDDILIREAAVVDEVDRSQRFDALRKNYRVRREFTNITVQPRGANPALIQKIKAMGFSVDAG